MSCVYKGKVVDTEVSKAARGGTEMMRDRLLTHVDPVLLEKVAIHFSRPRQVYRGIPNIFYAHDLATDPENRILHNCGWKNFSMFVFVSYWQRDQYMMMYGIPHSRSMVIHNAIEDVKHPLDKNTSSKIRFIYHTTPHRGLELLVPVFERLTKAFPGLLHLDVYSSFKIYGWEQRDAPYQHLFEKIKAHPDMTYHGTQDNDVVLAALAKSHFFFYPCIWQETSCIAMIEAMAHKCITVCPDYAALTETQQFGPSIMYEYHEDPNVHAQRAYDMMFTLLSIHVISSFDFINSIASDSGHRPETLNVKAFAGKWDTLLGALTNDQYSSLSGNETK